MQKVLFFELWKAKAFLGQIKKALKFSALTLWELLDSNQRPPACKAEALPLIFKKLRPIFPSSLNSC